MPQSDSETMRGRVRRARSNRIVLAALLLFLVVFLSVNVLIRWGPPGTTVRQALYHVVVTLTTVGYEEGVPVRGQAGLMYFNMALMLVGTGVLVFAVSTVTAALVEFDLEDLTRRRRMRKKIATLQHHYIVCGGGETGTHIVDELAKTNSPFVVLEANDERIRFLSDHYPRLLYIQGDATDDDLLEEAGILRARGLCATLDNDKDNLYLTLTARNMNPQLRIVARGIGPHCQAKLTKAGANAIVTPTAIGGLRMASELIRPHTVSFLDQMLRDSQATHRFGELPVNAGHAWAGKPIRDLPLRNEGILVVAVCDPSGHFHYAPHSNHVVEPGSNLIVLADTAIVAAMRASLTGESLTLAAAEEVTKPENGS